MDLLSRRRESPRFEHNQETTICAQIQQAFEGILHSDFYNTIAIQSATSSPEDIVFQMHAKSLSRDRIPPILSVVASFISLTKDNLHIFIPQPIKPIMSLLPSSSSSRPPQILEVTQLSTTLNSTPKATTSQSQPSTSLLLCSLRRVRNLLAEKVRPTYSRFYSSAPSHFTSNANPRTPTQIIILGLWSSVDEHRQFLANDELRDEILAPQEGVLGWNWTGHVALPPLSLLRDAPTGGEGDGEGERAGDEDVREKMSRVRVVEIGRWSVSVSRRHDFVEMLKRQDREGRRGFKGEVIAEGWDVDIVVVEKAGGEDMVEYIRVKGWEEKDANGVGKALDGHEGWEGGGWLWEEERNVCERIAVDIYWNLEG